MQYNVGILLLQTGLWDLGIDILHQSLALFEEVQDLRTKAYCFTFLGSHYGEQRLYKQAFSCFDQALEAIRPIQFPEFEVSILLKMVWVYIQQQAYDMAQATLEDIDALDVLVTDYFDQWMLKLAQGYVFAAQDKRGDADALFSEVQRSNMSKACDSMEDAVATQKKYKDEQGVESYVKQVGEEYLVYRSSDSKVLKSVNYSPADIKGMLKK